VRKKLTTKRLRQPDMWKRHKLKKKVAAGESHINEKGSIIAAKSFKYVDCKCKMKCCSKINENECHQEFKFFYQLLPAFRQSDYIAALIEVLPTKKSTSGGQSVKKKIHKMLFK
jgi:hypothetical protein